MGIVHRVGRSVRCEWITPGEVRPIHFPKLWIGTETGVISRNECLEMDLRDPLARYRDLFKLPPDTIYLDGGSLGAMPKSAPSRMEAAMHEWGNGVIRSWNDAGWYLAPQRAGDAIAKLIGAKAGEVIVADSTSVNLFKVLVAAVRQRPNKAILTESGNFPTNGYIARSVAELTDRAIVRVEPDEILEAINDSVAVVSLTHVNFRNSRRYDLQKITHRAHEAGALVVWDLCHSVGVMPLDVNRNDVDFAVGCGYKYLNGGPGAPAFVFVAERHQETLRQPLTGWHGHARPFDFEEEYVPHTGIERMLVGTAPQLGLLALEEALKVYEGADLLAIREKSEALGNLFIACVDQQLGEHGFVVASPRVAANRGSHVALIHSEAHAITQAMIQRGRINGYRAPDLLRFGLSPLYLRYSDIWDTVQSLRNIVEGRVWDKAEYKVRKAVS